MNSTPININVEYVYISHDVSHSKNLYKIGYTKNSPFERIQALSSYNGVGKHELFACASTIDGYLIEQEVHEALKDFRVSYNREFYDCPLRHIIYTLASVLKRSKLDDFLKSDDVSSSIIVFYEQNELYKNKHDISQCFSPKPAFLTNLHKTFCEENQGRINKVLLFREFPEDEKPKEDYLSIEEINKRDEELSKNS